MIGRTLEAERLTLEPFHSEVISLDYLRWMRDPLINQFLESRHVEQSLDSLREFVRSIAVSDHSYLFKIIERSNQSHIGNIKVGPISKEHLRSDIGILLGERDFWGKGFATEAISLISNFCFIELGLHKLTAGCYSSNEGSRKAFEAAGFSVEAIQQHQFLDQDGIWNSGIILARFRDDLII